MAKQLTFDDLTEKDLTRIRIQHKIFLSDKKNLRLSYEQFIIRELSLFNRGKKSVIERDMFVEVEEPEIKPTVVAPKPVKPTVQEKVSNIGKKLIIEFDDDQVVKYTLVANSDEIDPDKNKISIHSDMGKLIHFATEGEIIITDYGLVRVVEIQNTI